MTTNGLRGGDGESPAGETPPFGLDALSESVYRLLLLHPEDGPPQIAGRLARSETEILGSLERLADLALVRPPGATGRWRALSPEAGMAVLLARQEAEAARRQAELDHSRGAMASLIAEFSRTRQSSPPSGVEIISSLQDVRERLEQLASEAVAEVLSFAPGGPQPAAVMEASRALDRQSLERGVRMRTVFLDSVRNDQATVQYAQWLNELGGTVRTVPALPLRMIIADGTTAVVPLDPGDSDQGAVLLRSPGVIAALRALFEQVWEHAKPLGEEVQRDGYGLTGQERQLLRLLSEGLTDERAAQRLGVSLRTIRRMMAALMTRLDSRSRFQAGIKVAASGWLTDDPLARPADPPAAASTAVLTASEAVVEPGSGQSR
ncbi:LuxR C-terminal-related transcriptional regulator [Actinacidiphila sp. DG2A-62]|uniref:LuxR C-terminal-related transcriptional regulator n=1 Tax=Actinacidiphila sp. DG2A-62 TaxID=3108821 RepID=UPI002DBAF249|nr:LuxR C-terminal-related transcriptional regulator [Actinacidiphila sp. DG2A-62]MEC3997662.1 LuxR C-terminal-related transcriptional regulator [Actinacidiphila sp. DG2A-62]